MSEPPIRFSMAPRILAATLELRGPYNRIGGGMKRLQSWMKSMGIRPAGNPFALFYDNPEGRNPRELRSEVCFPVSEPFQSKGRVKLKELPETPVAETRHVGPPEKFGLTYGPFLEWLVTNGYDVVGPAREFYDGVTARMSPGSGVLIQQPVLKR